MAANNSRSNEQAGDNRMGASDWRALMPSDLRRKVIDKIMEKLKERFPSSDPTQINNLREYVVKFEERAYSAATDQTDYLRKISLKMGNITQNAHSVNMQSGSSAYTSNPAGQVQHVNQGQYFPTTLPANQAPVNASIPGSAGLPQAVVAQNANIHNSFGAQNASFSTSEAAPSNVVASSERRILPQQQQPQQQLQSSNYMQQQQQMQLLNQNLRNGNLQRQHNQGSAQPIQQQLQQQRNQTSVQPIQQQIRQHTSSVPFAQSAVPSGLSSGQQISTQQHPQSVLMQQQPQQDPSIYQKQMHIPQQTVQQQEQEQLMSQRINNSEMQHRHLMGLQNSGDMQQRAYRLSSQQKNTAILQQQQQAMLRQNIHKQGLGPQSNASALSPQQQQQQKMLGTQSGNRNLSMPSNQHAVNSSQQLKYLAQHNVQQSGSGSLQPQAPHQQMVMQRVQLEQTAQHQMGMQQSMNPGQHNMQQRFQGAQNVANQQNHMYQLQRAPASSSTSQDSVGMTGSASGGDWQEELYQKINSLKEMYLPDLTVMFQKFASKLQQIDSLPQHQLPDIQIDKMRVIKMMLERIIEFVTVTRSGVSEMHREKFSNYEKQILNFFKNQRSMKPMMQQQRQGQLPNYQTRVGQQETQSVSPLSGLSTSQPGTLHSSQTGNELRSPRDVALTSHHQSPVGTSRLSHPNSSAVQSHSGVLQQRQIQQQVMQRQQMIQEQQLRQEANQKLQTPSPRQANSTNDMKMKQGMNIQAGLLQQRQVSSLQQSKPVMTQLSNSSSPLSQQTASPQLSQHSQHNLPVTARETGTPSRSVGSPSVTPSPITPLTLSPMPRDSGKPVESLPHATNATLPRRTDGQAAVQSASSSALVKRSSPLPEPIHGGSDENVPASLPPQPSVERPIDRLIRAVQSAPQRSLAESVSEMRSVVRLVDTMGASASYDGSRAGVGEDLAAMTESRLQAGSFVAREGTNAAKKMKRSLTALTLDIASSIGNASDGDKPFSTPETEVDSTASPRLKRQKIQPDHALVQEIKEINQRLIDSVVEICHEDDDNSSRATFTERGEGTLVTCSYLPVALSPTFKALYTSGRMSQVQPLRLLIPENYPNSSPIFLDDISTEASDGHEDLSVKTKSRLSLALRKLSEPMSLRDIAKTWAACARGAVCEYAESHGGGSFSSKYGSWKSCLRAS